MKIIILASLIALLQSCEAPTKQRVYQTSSGSTTTTTTTSTETSSDENDSETETVISGTGFSGCDLSYNYYNSTIGYFGMCQSTTTETMFKIKMANTDTTIGTCFVPIYVSGTGSSYNVGTAECVNNQASTVYTVSFTKTNSSYAINGMMVLKANALSGYEQCMSARDTFIAAYGGTTCSSNSNCLAAANNYANNICSTFMSTYSSYYVQVNL